MTLKQQEKILSKIKKIKAALAADKRRWGGVYDDSRGLRYMPPQLYIKIGDYTESLKYLTWFHKNFPDDSGFPDFLFEWTIILFKSGRDKEAEKKAFQTYCRNTYVFDKFFGRPIKPIDKSEYSNFEEPDFAIKYFDYSCMQDNLSDFAEWLDKFTQSEVFIRLSQKFIDIQKRLKTEQDTKIRHSLIEQEHQLESEL